MREKNRDMTQVMFAAMQKSNLKGLVVLAVLVCGLIFLGGLACCIMEALQ